MLDFVQSWCGPIVALLLWLLVQFWLQLLKWKSWGDSYKQWVHDFCSCEAPGGNPEPTEPGWPS